MFTVPEIIKVHDEFEFDGIEQNFGNVHANYVYLDTKDPINEKNSYVWSWQLWELQDICSTCEGVDILKHLDQQFADVSQVIKELLMIITVIVIVGRFFITKS